MVVEDFYLLIFATSQILSFNHYFNDLDVHVMVQSAFVKVGNPRLISLVLPNMHISL